MSENHQLYRCANFFCNTCIYLYYKPSHEFYGDLTIICPKPVNDGLNIDCELIFMAKEKPEIEETEKQLAIRKEIRKEWSTIEPKLIDMAHKLEDNGLIGNRDYIWLKSRISNLSKHFDKQ